MSADRPYIRYLTRFWALIVFNLQRKPSFPSLQGIYCSLSSSYDINGRYATRKSPMPPEPVLKKLIVDQQFEPSLQVVSCMDGVGIAMAPGFPEWNRGPVNLELFNKAKHQRLIVNLRQVAFETDSPGTEDERVEIITAVMKAYESRLGFPKFARFSVHGFFAAATQESFATVCERVERNFLAATGSIPAFQSMKMTERQLRRQLRYGKLEICGSPRPHGEEPMVSIAFLRHAYL